jgi:hypothetical protein
VARHCAGGHFIWLEGDFMSWQDELAQLDSALASGQISADEYRNRRDRVIAQASGQSAPEQQQQPQQGAEPTAVFRAVQPQQQPQQQGDRTQVVSGQAPSANEHTQVVNRPADADSTQIVSNMPQRPHFPPPQPPPPWESQQPHPQAMTPPPWANEDLPPEFGQQSWPRQGPEVFEEKSGGGTGKIVGIVIAVVVVLALAGGAIWFFGFKDSGDNNQAGNETSQENPPQTTSSKPPPPDIPEGPFLDLPGDKIYNRTVPIAQAVAEKVPTPDEATLLQSVGVAEVGGLVTEENDLRTGLWAFKVGETGDPAAVLKAIDELYQQAKYELVSEDDGIKVRKLAAATPDAPTVFRAHYVTDDGYLVRVEVYGTDSANVESTFNDLLADETDEFAPAS